MKREVLLVGPHAGFVVVLQNIASNSPAGIQHRTPLDPRRHLLVQLPPPPARRAMASRSGDWERISLLNAG